MLGPVRKILIADPDLDSVRGLSRALRQKQYQVHYAPDGSKALQVAVLRHPNLILFDERCQLLEARTFVSILRSNPRTEDIPVVLTVGGGYSEKVQGLRDGYLHKPFNLDEVLSRIEHVFRRSDAAKQLRGEAKEIEGALGQLSLPDLLQVLAMNRRSGRLSLMRDPERGEIHVANGRPVNARVGPVEGEKAFFRLLTWSEGTFAFMPSTTQGRERISRGMDDALLEGLRQADELARLATKLPARHLRVELAADADLTTQTQHPVTAQVVEALNQPRTVADVVDLATAVDLDVVAALVTLLEKGVARVSEVEDAQAPPLLRAAEVHALRTRLFRGRPATRRAVAKVVVCGELALSGRKLLEGLPHARAVGVPSELLQSGFGTLAQWEVSEALSIDFCFVPSSDAARPLWRPFCSGAMGAWLLDSSEAGVALARYLAFEVRVPTVVAGGSLPPQLKGAPAGAQAVPGALVDSLRTLMVLALRPFAAAEGVRLTA
ncbi:MAG: DUF4388 domain-containing protein [Myxococcaceae bacterium]